MGWAIGAGHGWRAGYMTVSVIQILLSVMLFAALPLWKRKDAQGIGEETYEAPIGIIGAMKIRGVKSTLVAFFGYCAFEATAGLWASSYLVEYRGVDAESAAFFASLFYLGITGGRFLSGFFADRIGDRNMIRIGIAAIGVGIVLVLLPLEAPGAALTGLVIFGIGAAPIYPSVIHATPAHFGRENSHAIVGIQMAGAYFGCTFMPPIFGLIAQYVHIGLYPYCLSAFVLLLLVMTERVNKICGQKA